MAIAGRPLIRVQTGRVVGIIDGRGRTKGRERQNYEKRADGGRTDGDRYSHFCVMIIVIAGLLTNTLTYAFAAPFGRKVRQNHPFGDFFPEMPQKCRAFLCNWHFGRNDPKQKLIPLSSRRGRQYDECVSIQAVCALRSTVGPVCPFHYKPT